MRRSRESGHQGRLGEILSNRGLVAFSRKGRVGRISQKEYWRFCMGHLRCSRNWPSFHLPQFQHQPFHRSQKVATRRPSREHADAIRDEVMKLKCAGAICHAPNPIPRFVTMTGMLISSLNLILTRTNLTFSKTFTKAFLFLFILVSLLKWYNSPLDIQSIYIVLQRITQSIDYSYSKFHIIHLLIL